MGGGQDSGDVALQKKKKGRLEMQETVEGGQREEETK